MSAFTSTAYSRDLGDELRLLRESCTALHGRGRSCGPGYQALINWIG